jgi:hypothetical protein
MIHSATYHERKARSRDLTQALSEVMAMAQEISDEQVGTTDIDTDDANDFYNLEGIMLERALKFSTVLLAYKREREALTELHEAAAAEDALMQRGELGYGHLQAERL